MSKKHQKEEVGYALCVGLNDVYIQLRTADPPDLVGLTYLANVYDKCRMPGRAKQILQEVSTLTELRKSVLDGGIIVTDNTSGLEVQNETRIPLSADRPDRAVPCGQLSP